MDIFWRFIFVPLFVIALALFYWSIDCIFHNKKQKIPAIISSLIFFAVFILYAVLSAQV